MKLRWIPQWFRSGPFARKKSVDARRTLRRGYAPQADLLHMLRFAELSGIAS